MLPPALDELARLLGRLRGVGRKTAQRLALQLLDSPDEYLLALGASVSGLRARVRRCSRCRGLTERDPCPLCDDPRRRDDLLCVVAGVPDQAAVEASGARLATGVPHGADLGFVDRVSMAHALSRRHEVDK